MSTFNLNRAALGAAHIAAADKEREREALKHIWIRDGHIEAADGFVMARIRPDNPIEDVETSIPVSDALAAVRKTTPTKTGATVEVGEGGLSITSEAKPAETLSAAPAEDHVTFPDLRFLINEKVPHETVILSRTLLKKVLKSVDSAVSSKTPDDGIEFRFFGPDSGVQARVTSDDGDEITYVIMPMAKDGWKFDDPGASRKNLLEHHIRQAILDGRAGHVAADLEKARIKAEENDEHDPLLNHHEIRWASASTIREAVDKRVRRDTIREAMLAAELPEEVIEKAMDVVVGHEMEMGVA